MNYSITKSFIIVLLVSLFSNVFSSNMVVKWNGGTITLDQFEHDMLLYVFYNDKNKASKSSLDKKRKHLRGMTLKYLILQYAKDTGIDTLRMFRKEYNGRLYAISKKKLLADSIQSKLFTENNIRDRYTQKLLSPNNDKKLKPFELEKSNIIKELVTANNEKFKLQYYKFRDSLFDKYNLLLSTDKMETFSDKYKNTKLEDLIGNPNLFFAISDIGNYSELMFINKLKTIGPAERDFISKDANSILKIVADHFEYLSFRKAVVDLGYTSIPKLKKEANQNMLFELRDYILAKIVYPKLKGNNKSQKKKLETDFENFLLRKYNIFIDYPLLENSFNFPLDLRK